MHGGFLFLYGNKAEIFYAGTPAILPVPLTGVRSLHPTAAYLPMI